MHTTPNGSAMPDENDEKPKHTSTPWYVNQFKGKYFRVSPNQFGCNDKSQYVAEQIKTKEYANLIAAAPELLEALERIISLRKEYEDINFKDKTTEGIKKAREEAAAIIIKEIVSDENAEKAIAKAKGE